MPVVQSARRLARFAKILDVQQWTLKQTAESYTGRLGKRYTKAYHDIVGNGGPVRHQDTFIKAFVKAEKFNPGQKPSKPRLVFGRDPRYNLEICSYLKPLEHALWHRLKGGRKWGVKPTRVIGKGLSPWARAQLISEKWASRTDWVCFEVDGSSWEAHMATWQLSGLEHPIYLAAYNGDKRLAKLLSWQLVNRGSTPSGIRFSREGGKCSGDYNTGLGNSLVMFTVVEATLLSIREELGEFAFDMLVDGDNAILWIPAQVVVEVRNRFFDVALKLSGHEIVLENAVTSLEQTVFGQSKPVLSARGLTMCRSPYKILSNSFSSYKHLKDLSFGRRVLRSVAEGEYALGKGIPVVGKFCYLALESLANEVPVGYDMLQEFISPFAASEARLPEFYGFRRHLSSVRARRKREAMASRPLPEFIEPTTEARVAFEVAFGISADEQRAIERKLVGLVCFPNDWGPQVRDVFDIRQLDDFDDTCWWDSLPDA
jgi:hypothetical protein